MRGHKVVMAGLDLQRRQSSVVLLRSTCAEATQAHLQMMVEQGTGQ
jgi:hypothetical protein